jgi:hypothetical protein
MPFAILSIYRSTAGDVNIVIRDTFVTGHATQLLDIHWNGTSRGLPIVHLDETKFFVFLRSSRSSTAHFIQFDEYTRLLVLESVHVVVRTRMILSGNDMEPVEGTGCSWR